MAQSGSNEPAVIRPATSQPPPAKARSTSAAASSVAARHSTRRAVWVADFSRAHVLPSGGRREEPGFDGLGPQHEVFQQRLEVRAPRRDPGGEQAEVPVHGRDQGHGGRRSAVVDGEEGERDRAHGPW